MVLEDGIKVHAHTLSETWHPRIPSNHRLSSSRSPELATDQCVSKEGSRGARGEPYAIPRPKYFSQSHICPRGGGSSGEIATHLDGICKIPRFVSMPDVHRGRGVHEQGIRDRVFVVVVTRPPDWRLSHFSGEWEGETSVRSPPPPQSLVHSFAM